MNHIRAHYLFAMQMLFVAALLAAPACKAQSAFAEAYVCSQTTLPAPLTCVGNIFEDANSAFGPPTPAKASLNKSWSSADGQVQLAAKDSVNATYGQLRAASSETFSISGTPVYLENGALADVSDVITISYPPSNGRQGLLFLRYKFFGKATSLGKDWVDLGVVGVVAGTAPVPACNQFVTSLTGSVRGLFYCPNSFHFIYGQPFTMSLFLSTGGITTSYARGPDCCVWVATTGKGSGSANFFDTLVLVGLEATDANGNPLPSPPTITAASGTTYSADGILTPFSKFGVSELEPDDNEFQMQGSFTLGDNSSGIDPATQDVALLVGNFSVGIPVGSFQLESQSSDSGGANVTQYVFDGQINGVLLHFKIQSLTGNQFHISASGQGAGVNAAKVANPVKVNLVVGMDGGTTTANADE